MVEPEIYIKLGTLAHNRRFTRRDFLDHIGPGLLSKLVRMGDVEINQEYPFTYYPTAQGWEKIEEAHGVRG